MPVMLGTPIRINLPGDPPAVKPVGPDYHSSISPFLGVRIRMILSGFSRHSGSNASFSLRMASTVLWPSSCGR